MQDLITLRALIAEDSPVTVDAWDGMKVGDELHFTDSGIRFKVVEILKDGSGVLDRLP